MSEIILSSAAIQAQFNLATACFIGAAICTFLSTFCIFMANRQTKSELE